MNILFSILLFIHGFAHLVGFIVAFQIKHFDEMPYKTTLLNGKINIGDSRIKIIGILWLLLSFLFLISVIIILYDYYWWDQYTLIVSSLSLLLCIFGLPDSKFGILMNLFILALILVGNKFNLY